MVVVCRTDRAGSDTITPPMADAANSALRPSCDPATALDARFRAAIRTATGAEADPQIRVSGNAKFGDFQMNAAMALAKERGTNPRALADEILKATDLAGIAVKCEVAGPGFINITLDPAFLAARVDELSKSATFGIPPANDPHAVVIDLCGVNVAKQMHVGHLRATIIGDSLARVFERLCKCTGNDFERTVCKIGIMDSRPERGSSYRV